MTRVHTCAVWTVGAILAGASAVRADVRADEKTRVELAGVLGRVMNVFGGKAAREGVASTVIVKGDRKATLHDNDEQIVDLAEENVYDIDLNTDVPATDVAVPRGSRKTNRCNSSVRTYSRCRRRCCAR